MIVRWIKFWWFIFFSPRVASQKWERTRRKAMEERMDRERMERYEEAEPRG